MKKNTSAAKGIIGIIALALIVILVIKLVDRNGNGSGKGHGKEDNNSKVDSNSIPSTLRPFLVKLTAHYGGDQSKPYEVKVFINNNQQGLITMTYEGIEHSRRFAYSNQNKTAEMISIVFQAITPGADQLPGGEWYFLSIYKGNKAVLDWYQRTASGTWAFIK